MILMSRKQSKALLFENTIMLYVLVLSSYILSFITIPYQTRILGPDYFGRVSFALAFMGYFQLIIDFGFMLSATEDVAKHQGNKKELSRIVSSIGIIKIIFATVLFLILLSICTTVPRFQEDKLLYIFTYLSVATASLLPDFLYRGLEKMRIITIRTILIRLFFILMLFAFLKDERDYYMVPLFSFLGNVGAILGIYLHIKNALGLTFERVDLRYLIQTVKKSSIFFYSRIATTAYTVTNTFILGLINAAGSQVVGLYSSADRLVTTAKSGFSPIADSLYPYMVKNRDFKLVRKVLLFIMPPVILGTLIVWIYANDFCALLFGNEFRDAGHILRALLPIVILTPMIYLLGFPVLSPMGLSKHANLSVIVSSVFHISGLLILLALGKLDILLLCYLTVLTECIILVYRVVVIRINKKLLK